MQKKLTVLFAFAIFVLVVGWAITFTPALAKKGGNGKGGGGGGGGDTIRVMVTFRDFLASEAFSPDHLMSDCQMGNCPYIDKVVKVSTGIGTSGNFFMKLTKGNQQAIRTLFLDFSDCASFDDLGVPTCNPPFPTGFTVGPANMFTSGINLRDFTGTRGDLRLRVPFDLTSIEGGLWSLFFDSSIMDCPGSSSIGVTRTNVDTWVIEAGQGAVACLARLAGGGELIFSGLYIMPFKITVQEK